MNLFFIFFCQQLISVCKIYVSTRVFYSFDFIKIGLLLLNQKINSSTLSFHKEVLKRYNQHYSANCSSPHLPTRAQLPTLTTKIVRLV